MLERFWRERVPKGFLSSGASIPATRILCFWWLVSRTVTESPSWTPTTRPVKVAATPGNGKNANATTAHRNLNMLDLTGYGRLAELTKLTDRMISEASKGAIVDAARMLAVQVGHYQRKFGAFPLGNA